MYFFNAYHALLPSSRQDTVYAGIEKCIPSSMISTGSSTNVYCVEIEGNLSVIKELFPVGLAEREQIFRFGFDFQTVRVRKTPQAFIQWWAAKKRFINAYIVNDMLQKVTELSDFIVPVHLFMKKNGTLYSVSFMPPGKPLDKIENFSPEKLLILGLRIAEKTEAIHRQGWLIVDIKAANYIVYDPYEKLTVRMTDFDSAVPIGQIGSTRKFMCSNETASPEMLRGDRRNIGEHSDVYSLASMLTMILAKRPVTQYPEAMINERVKPLLDHWKPTAVKALADVLLSALQPDPMQRIKTCRELADGLLSVCEMEGLDYADLLA